MKLVYDSLTGNTRRFAEQLALASGLPLETVTAYTGGPALLLTYTFAQGSVPDQTAKFLSRHASQLRGVVSSGSFHWGQNFGRAGRSIAEQFGVPLVAIINKSGSQADLALVKDWLHAQMD